MIPMKSRPQEVPSSSFGKRAKRRLSPQMLIGAGVLLAMLLVAGAFVTTQALKASHAAPRDNSYDSGYNRDGITTINGLKKIAMIGSTANIWDKNGNKITVDPNPYGIAIARHDDHGLRKGDLLVTNIGNMDKGSTIVKFSGQNGQGKLFNTMPNNGTLGPADLIFNHRTGSLWVANATGNFIQVYRPNGTVMTTIKDPLFNGPWGIATNGNTTFFTSNKFDGKILRIDIIQRDGDTPRFQVTQIGQFDKNGDATKIGLTWLPKLKIGDREWNDVLLAIDPANSRIAAFANSSKRAWNDGWNMANGMGKGITVFMGKPLNMPGGFAINPFNGDLLVVNLGDNNLVELNMTRQKVVGVKQIDPQMVDNQGNGSALFGVAAIKDDQGNLRVFFTDDNTNSLDVLKAE